MTEETIPDCDRCDDTELDPDAYTVVHNDDGSVYSYRPEPCRNCQPQQQ